jgi:hypothetical protein
VASNMEKQQSECGGVDRNGNKVTMTSVGERFMGRCQIIMGRGKGCTEDNSCRIQGGKVFVE